MNGPQDIGAGTATYGELRASALCACREGATPFTEEMLQRLWNDQGFLHENLRTEEGHSVEVVSPGWWNRQEGPDFQGAQIRFNGQLYSGDIEVHLDKAGWRAHGHHVDRRYDGVVLHVVHSANDGGAPVYTSEGRQVPTLRLFDFIESRLDAVADSGLGESIPPFGTERGLCAAIHEARHGRSLESFLALAGDWRMLGKARSLGDRMGEVGGDQALYEATMYACGFSPFKHHFAAIARALPYERARQLGMRDPLLLETALLQLGGLLPEDSAADADSLPHLARLRALKQEHLEGLRSLRLSWRRNGVRPVNYPERRLAGAARLIARTSQAGLLEQVMRVWQEHRTPLSQRRAFEGLFPRAMGFWATRCTWRGKESARPAMPIGAGRVRSIIGNVFVPVSIAVARRERDRTLEERIFAFYAVLPKEADNHVVKRMAPRVMGNLPPLRLNFRLQQGLLQMYQDWCEPNPSCRNCLALRFFEEGMASPDAPHGKGSA